MSDAEGRARGLPQPLRRWLAAARAPESAAGRAALARGVMLRLCALHGLTSAEHGHPATERVWRPHGPAGDLLDRLLPAAARTTVPAALSEDRALALSEALSHPTTNDDLRRRAPTDLSALFEPILAGGDAARRITGVFYTPPHLVGSIIASAVGVLLAERGPAAQLRVLDPACGAGAFLLAAAQAIDAARGTGQPPALLGIYGVDIDPYAVAATRLALLLAAPPGTPRDELLDALERQIVCGNALLSHADAPERADAVALPDAAAGFDAVIGNPPFLNLKRGAIGAEDKRLYAARYGVARGQYDVFGLFVERSLELLAPGGALAFVVPRPLLSAASYEPVRRLLLRRRLVCVADAGAPFRAAVEAAVIVVRGEPPGSSTVRLERLRPGVAPLELGTVAQQRFDALPTISFRVTERSAALIERLARAPTRIGDAALTLTRGLEIGKRAALRGPARGSLPLLRGEDLSRYRVQPSGLFAIADRPIGAGPVVLVRRVAGRVEAALDESGSLTLNTIYTLAPRPDVDHWLLLACLNAWLTSYYVRALWLADDRLFPYLRMAQIATLPLPDSRDESLRRGAAALAKRLHRLHATLPAANDPGHGAARRAIDEADRELDKLVYALYGLSAAEAALVEAERDGTRVERRTLA